MKMQKPHPQKADVVFHLVEASRDCAKPQFITG
jgi:hypothetical protein